MAVDVSGRVRVRFAWWLHAAVFAAVAAAALVFGPRLGDHGTELLLPPAAFAAFLVMEKAVLNRPCRVTLAGGVLTLGRLATGPVEAPVRRGNWFTVGTGASAGTVAYVRLRGRTYRIGGLGVLVPPGADGPPARSVRLTLAPPAFEALMAGLGLRAGGSPAVHIDLFDAPDKGSRARRQTLVALAVVLPLIGLGSVILLSQRRPPLALNVGLVAVIVVAMMVASWTWGGAGKPADARWRLAFTADGVQLWRDHRLIASGVPAWRLGVWVTDTPLYTRQRTPAIELALPAYKPIVIGGPGEDTAWAATTELPAPRYYVGRVDFARLAGRLPA